MNELADKSDDEGSRVCFLRIGRDPRWFRHIREREYQVTPRRPMARTIAIREAYLRQSQ